jgi:CDP-glucose 4,6-dehydratase
LERLIQSWGDGASWSIDNGDHPHEAHYLKLDCSKAKTRLNWHPTWTLDIALEKIVEWQKRYQLGADMKQISQEQIDAYNNARA